MKRKLIYCFNQNISGLGTSGNDVGFCFTAVSKQKWPTEVCLCEAEALYKQILSFLAGYICLLCM